ncbi:putative Thymidylate kinase [Seiridium cardinale]
MAAVTRQPFAPIEASRLQTLTSLKNKQNAVTIASPVKRKASDIVDADDFENVDPVLSSKRSKGSDSFYPTNDFVKPSNFILTKSASTNNIASPLKLATPRPRSLLQPKSPAARLNTGIAKSSPLSAPAGRSPTRGKRTGLLSSRRRTAGPYTRVDPPVLGLGASVTSSPAPFSLDAALKGTIPSYTSRNAASVASSSRSSGPSDLHGSSMKSDWFFDIHEDTAEQEMTNLLQHSTCVLDISSDEESESRLERERVEGKENVPPVDDMSQTSRSRAARTVADIDDMIFEKERNPLGEMNVRDYYAEGCDETSIIFILGDDEEEAKTEYEFAPEVQVEQAPVPVPEPIPEDGSKSVDELLQKTDEPAPSAALLQPIDGNGESFEVWESGSAKDETEAVAVC